MENCVRALYCCYKINTCKTPNLMNRKMWNSMNILAPVCIQNLKLCRMQPICEDRQSHVCKFAQCIQPTHQNKTKQLLPPTLLSCLVSASISTGQRKTLPNEGLTVAPGASLGLSAGLEFLVSFVAPQLAVVAFLLALQDLPLLTPFGAPVVNFQGWQNQQVLVPLLLVPQSDCDPWSGVVGEWRQVVLHA